MTVEELAKLCANRIASGQTMFTVVLPGYSRGNSRRLFGRFGPKGEVVSDTGTDKNPESIVAFDPVKVLAYLAARGLVRVEVEPASTGSVEVYGRPSIDPEAPSLF